MQAVRAHWGIENGLHWVLGTGCWALGAGHWVLGTGCWALGAGHWVLGTGCWALGAGHWVLDVTFREDASRVRKDNAPQNMATLRHIALNTLKRNTTRKTSLKRKRQRAAWEPTFLTELTQN